MRQAIEQRAPGRLSPIPASVGSFATNDRAHVESMVRGFEVLAERLIALDYIPLDLLERFARSLNAAERSALARVKHMEEQH